MRTFAKSSIAIRVNNVCSFSSYVWRRFTEDGCPATAATLSYTLLLALAPLAAIVFGVMAVVPAFEGVGAKINLYIFGYFIPDTGEKSPAISNFSFPMPAT